MARSTQCHVCGAEVASSAVRCPNCDAHFPGKPGKHELQLWGCGLLWVLPFLAIVFLIANC